ncbi:MAG: sulfatase-like hydrolase/transferase [Acidobacteria bacterium]|nr:sulfatase-like hydrolase/transferase [Acidobacteriota bacterium]
MKRATIVILVWWCVACGGCASRSAPPPAGALRGANVLLVTIDTLRADRVGAYGSRLGLTPTLDRLAAEGLRFEVARAHVPLTLPSHATIMTGRYPVGNGVHDNGSFRYSGTGATLAATLRAAGYRTGAFVGAFVLDARFGLGAGFDRYDDRMIGGSTELDVVQRTADEVLTPAADWILHSAWAHGTPAPGTAPSTSAPGTAAPFFAWVHLYDPHEPYDPPEPYRARYAADPYAGEVAYADAVLGRFFDRLRASGALDRTLIVVTSDHGESLGEHGERTHGLFAYEATLRVPLIFWAGRVLQPAVVQAPARLVDLMPTILDFTGIPVPHGLDGRSLRGVDERAAADDPGSYFEALNANLTRGWAPLKGFVRGGRKLIDLPLPELYDLAADPGETRNLYAGEREHARDLEARLDGVNAGAAAVAPSTVDPDAAARLRSLGYVVGAAPKPSRAYTAADDPKRLVHLNAALDDAAALQGRGDGAQAAATLRQVIAERPDMTVAYDRLAAVLAASGRIGEAVTVLDAAARDGHADRDLLRSLGSTLRDAGNLERSASVLEPLARDDAGDLRTLDALAQTYARTGRARDSEATFKRVLAASPNASATWNNLGTLYLMTGRFTDARDALSRATEINPALASAHNGLGVAWARLGDVGRAADEWRRALALRPDLADARANLERIGAR